MKTGLVLSTIVLSLASTSMAQSLHCQTKVNPETSYSGLNSIELTAENYLQDWMKNVTATVVFEDIDETKTVVGRRSELEKDANYNPRKYVGHVRYDLSKLVETTKFRSFEPADTCQLLVMIPENATELKRFNAPVTINCDQSGSKTVMKCEIQ